MKLIKLVDTVFIVDQFVCCCHDAGLNKRRIFLSNGNVLETAATLEEIYKALAVTK